MKERLRAIVILSLLAVGFTCISLRLVWLQLIEHEHYLEMAIDNHLKKEVVPARRGTILDASGNIVAQTHLLYDVRFDGKSLVPRDLPKMARLSELLGIPWAEFRANYEPNNRYQLLKKEVTEDVATAVRELGLPGLITEEKQARSYPNRWQASHIVGFLGTPDPKKTAADKKATAAPGVQVGLLGVEKAMNSFLMGVPGERWIERDARKHEIVAYRRRDTPAVDGAQVTLTIDMEIQHIVEDEADRLVRDFAPEGVCIIAMRPKTGEILALVNRPTFDPNALSSVTQEAMRNRCVTDYYEPGSIFKIVTLAGAINEGLVNLQTPINCYNGQFFYAGAWLHDHEAMGTIPVIRGLQVSSNIMMAQLGLTLGKERLHRYVSSFGFGAPTGMLPGQSESPGKLRLAKDWSLLSVTRIPMGQEVGATPIQMISALSAIANGGALMAPQIVKSVADEHGRIFKQYPPRLVRQVVSPRTAKDVSRALVSVVSAEGTGKRADVPGFTVAGKTGTAQKSENGQYNPDKHVSSFMGYLPEEDPQFALLIMVDEPKGKKYYAADVAAPAFATIAAQMAQALDLTPRPQPATKLQEAAL